MPISLIKQINAVILPGPQREVLARIVSDLTGEIELLKARVAELEPKLTVTYHEPVVAEVVSEPAQKATRGRQRSEQEDAT